MLLGPIKNCNRQTLDNAATYRLINLPKSVVNVQLATFVKPCAVLLHPIERLRAVLDAVVDEHFVARRLPVVFICYLLVQASRACHQIWLSLQRGSTGAKVKTSCLELAFEKLS